MSEDDVDAGVDEDDDEPESLDPVLELELDESLDDFDSPVDLVSPDLASVDEDDDFDDDERLSFL